MTGRMTGKRALVVGAGQTPGETIGNGRATALRFAQEGAAVACVDRDEASLRETVEMIEAEGGTAHAVVADIASMEACARLVADARAALGGIDVLHNNVGIGAGDSSPTRLDEDAFDRILRVNLKGTWMTCKHAVPIMREQGTGGAIVNISSTAAIAAAGNLTAYKVSKAGVNALTHGLAVSNARFRIRANAIMPGFMDTPMAVDAAARATGADRAEVAERRATQVPMGYQGTAWDVANAALFLASDEARYITGVMLPVDGGQTARIG
ncbi:SDR family NAD(P)-dependent oxidoreductase [Actinomarinicola tropica]|uniref:SDR family oxidoreductase n=1 Tax=Actinomarinicola tropica TaxID=2789776 RepID=A0A5Q2RMP7_9ACTN|nr:SDR family NAD(P)-dependent oxidoreductase [Actinomarinicola tropica]QGG94465.1 SDR family oxidoreductase [Actinomarinicola tropica]